MGEIKFENIKKLYGEKAALNNFNLQVNDGEFLVLLGNSGSGKTSALRAVCGLDEVDEGNIIINGIVVNDMQPKDRNVAIIFQNNGLYPHLNIAENIAFGLKLRKVPEKEISAKLKIVSKLLGLQLSMQKRVKSASAIERQRAMLARAIVKEPAVYLIDNPFKGMDDRLALELRTEYVKVQKRLNATFIFSTIDQIEAMSIADRIAVIDEGKVLQVGTPEEIYDNPNCVFVADYIGSPKMNFADGYLENEDGKVYVNFFNLKTEIPDSEVKLLNENYFGADKKLLIAIRPEDITVNSTEKENSIKCIIESVENYGSYLFMQLKIDGVKTLFRWNGISSSTDYKIGDTVYITVDNSRFHYFDKETELSIKNNIINNNENNNKESNNNESTEIKNDN